MSENKMIEITKSLYDSLVKGAHKAICLELSGVSSWDGYDHAIAFHERDLAIHEKDLDLVESMKEKDNGKTIEDCNE